MITDSVPKVSATAFDYLVVVTPGRGVVTSFPFCRSVQSLSEVELLPKVLEMEGAELENERVTLNDHKVPAPVNKPLQEPQDRCQVQDRL